MKTGTAVKEFWSCNSIAAEVGTNCPQGGDAGHGGRTALRLKDEAGTCWRIAVDGEVVDGFRELVLEVAGDSECDTLIDALEWAAAELRQQQEANLRSRSAGSILDKHCAHFTENRAAALAGRSAGEFNDPFADHDEPETEIVKDAEGRDRPRWKEKT